MNTTPTQHSIIHGNACFAYFNKIWDIPHLRQLAHIATTRSDEEQMRQALAAMARLVQVYMTIDYATEHVESKQHAQLAASYLADAVERILPRNMPDVIMEGIRLIGRSAQLFLAAGFPNDIVPACEKIAAIACTGALKAEFRPITLTGMQQLARLTFELLRVKERDIRFAVEQVREGVKLVVQVFLNAPDPARTSTHSTYLAPYYSLAKTDTLGKWLTDLVNALHGADPNDESAIGIIRNIEVWADGLYRTEKELLLLAIEKRSHFAFDLVHWIAHITKLLTAVADAVATDDHTEEELQKHASWLISVPSWIPDDDKEVVRFVESLGFTELIFDSALDALSRDSHEVREASQELLIQWAFKAGHYDIGRHIFEKSILALITLVLWKEELGLIPWLKAELVKRLTNPGAPDQETRDSVALSLRGEAATLGRRDFEFSRVKHAMKQLDRAKLTALLNEIANLLSPGTTGGGH